MEGGRRLTLEGRRRLSAGAPLLLAVALACGACSSAHRPAAAPASQPRPLRLRAFTEPSWITAVAATDRWLFAGTRVGLVRWDLRAGGHVWLGVDEGLPSPKIEALATTPGGALWLATPNGVARTLEGAWKLRPVAPVGPVRILLPHGEDTVWAGGSEGLARLNGATWRRFLTGIEVTALVPDGHAGLWIGTADHGLAWLTLAGPEAGEAVSYGPREGCQLRRVQSILVENKTVYAVGTSGDASHVVVVSEDQCITYALEHSYRQATLARTPDGIQLVGGREVVTLMLAPDGAGAPKARPLRLVVAGKVKESARTPVKAHVVTDKAAKEAEATLPPFDPAGSVPAGGRAPAPKLFVVPTGKVVPPGVTTVLTHLGHLFVGTRGLGLARLGHPAATFLRTHALTEGAQRLTVACQGPIECYIATGGRQAWHFDGDLFMPATIDPEEGARVLAVVADAKGRVVAIHRGQAGQSLRLSRLTGETWVPIGVPELKVPFNVPEITFAVFAPSGRLWIGLRYRDQEGASRPYGAAEVDLDEATVVAHRTFETGETPAPGSLPVPNNVTGILFLKDDIWLATRSGACLIRGQKATLFTEEHGLESELLYDIGVGPGGDVWVATSRGIGRFDGTRWRFASEGPLAAKIRSLSGGEGGEVWVGTDRGLVHVTSGKMEVLGTPRGLLEGEVVDVAHDRFGRIWALSPKGVTLIER